VLLLLSFVQLHCSSKSPVSATADHVT